MKLRVRGWLTLGAMIVMLLTSLIVLVYQVRDSKSSPQTVTRVAQVIHIEDNNIAHAIDNKGNQWSFINKTGLQQGEFIKVIIDTKNTKENKDDIFLTYY